MVLTISSGYKNFDQTFGGYKKHGVTLFMQRPAMGAHLFMINSAMELAKQGEVVLYLSKNMTQDEFFRRTLGKLTNLPVAKLSHGAYLTKEENESFAQEIKEAVNIIGNKLRFSYLFDFEQMKEEITANQKKYNTSTVFIDSGGYTFTSEEIETWISFAKRQQVNIILSTALSRDLEKRSDKRPKVADVSFLHHLRDDMDMYGFYRDEVYHFENAKGNVLEINHLTERKGLKTELQVDMSKQIVQQ